MTERDIIDAIVSTQSPKFVCVPHCKTGQSYVQAGVLGIMDVWCMAKSWAHPLAVAYEIKVSRSDFLNDKKWPQYLDYCNEFYFIVPGKEVATPEEMPEGVGLKYVASTGTKIFTKKKAAYRNIEIPESLFKYILMSRASISKRDEIVDFDKRAYWSEWLKNKNTDYVFGNVVSKKIREFVNGEMRDLRIENSLLKSDNQKLEHVERFLHSIGIDPTKLKRYDPEGQVKERLDEIDSGFSKEFMRELYQCKISIDRILEHAKSEK